MSKLKLKLMSAGVLVACAFIAWRVAWATQGVGNTSTTLAGPVLLEELNINSNNEGVKVKIETKGQWQYCVTTIGIAPLGHVGWHSHPGPVFAMVTQRTLTKYEAGDPTPHVYPAGTGFVEEPGQVHIGKNLSETEPVEIVNLILNPLGQPTRIDEPQP